MNKLFMKFANLLPNKLQIATVRFYIDSKIKRHTALHVNGLEKLDCTYKRPYLFVCNHLSNSDGLVLNKVLAKEKLIFVAGKKLEANSMTNLGFKTVRTISISPNSADKDAVKRIVRAVNEGNNIFMFPEGTRSRTAKMIEAKKGILLIAKLTNAPIVPIGIWGTEKFMPVQKDMGKEAFYDADININIGDIFTLPKKSADETKRSWEEHSLNDMMMRIAELVPQEYRGIYEINTADSYQLRKCEG